MSFHVKSNSYGTVNYWIPEKKYECNSTKILALDLDWTLIKPVKGKIFPIDKDDWTFMIPDKIAIIKEYIDQGYKFVIFTNQALITKGKSYTMEGFKDRWQQIYNALNEHGIYSAYMLFAVYNDFYRKPCIGMWDFMENHLNGNIEIDKSKSIFVGDMAGRHKDHASTDLQFAYNIDRGLVFMVPEVFFKTEKTISPSNKTTVLLANLLSNEKIFNPWKYIEHLDTQLTSLESKNIETLDTLKQILKESSTTRIMIMFVGSPASTKSTLYTDHLEKLIKSNKTYLAKWLYMSQDTFDGTPAKFIKQVGANIKENKCCIIDNTNGTSATRSKLCKVARASGVEKIVAVHFNIDKPVVMHLNEIRNKLINVENQNKKQTEQQAHGKTHVPAVAIHTYWKHYEPVNLDEENIDMLLEYNFIPNVNANSDKTEYSADQYKRFDQFID